MDKSYKVIWTKQSLSNALAIKHYLIKKFSKKEVIEFEKLLFQFELTISNFPTLYPESRTQKKLRKAVIHRNTTVFYIFDKKQLIVIAMKDNRQKKASR